MKHAKHLVRVFLLLIVVFSCLEIVRQSVRPATFGELGHFRAAAIDDAKAEPVIYGDVSECASCHEEHVKSLAGSKHSTINCQLCHAPLSTHAAKGEKIADMPINQQAALCLRCHELLPARPADMAQINLAQHMKDQEIKDIDEPGVCLQCHDVHEPDL